VSSLPRSRPALPALAVPVAALALAASLAGCVSWPLQAGGSPDPAEADWQRHACDPAGGGRPSANAALAEGLRQAPFAIASDLADTLGDPLSAPLAQEESRAAWSTSGGGRVDIALRDGAFAMALYEGPGEPGVDALHALLVGWGVDPGTLWVGAGGEGDGRAAGSRLDGERLFQAELGRPAAWALGGLTWRERGAGQAFGEVAVLPFYDVAAPAAPVEEATARQAALAFSECEADGAGGLRGELVGWGVLHGSLAYVAAVDLGQTRCGDRWVYVDAGSGVVLGAHSEPCIG
jgi:hypothetical protein